MKKNLSLLMLLIATTTIFSCKSGSDNFVGKWVGCNDARYSCIITSKGNAYTFHDSNNSDIVFEKKADEVLSAIGKELTLRYDKQTNHLIVIGVDSNREQYSDMLCKNENNSGDISAENAAKRIADSTWIADSIAKSMKKQ